MTRRPHDHRAAKPGRSSASAVIGTKVSLIITLVVGLATVLSGCTQGGESRPSGLFGTTVRRISPVNAR